MRTVTTALLTAATLAVASTPATATSADRAAARDGAGWLMRHAPRGGDGAAADALVALRAGRRLGSADARARAAALRRSADRYTRTAGGAAKVILGLRAAGAGNARCAGRIDLLARMNRDRTNGRYGFNIYHHTYAMMAARALRAGPSRSSVDVLLRARGAGGWNLRMSRSGADSVSSTAAAILALRGAGLSPGSSSLRSAYAWMLRRRQPTGGFTEESGPLSQANPTALAIRASAAMGRRDARAIRALRSLQRGDGSFLFTRTDAGSRLLATNDAVLALSGRTQPVGALRKTPARCR